MTLVKKKREEYMKLVAERETLREQAVKEFTDRVEQIRHERTAVLLNAIHMTPDMISDLKFTDTEIIFTFDTYWRASIKMYDYEKRKNPTLEARVPTANTNAITGHYKFALNFEVDFVFIHPELMRYLKFVSNLPNQYLKKHKDTLLFNKSSSFLEFTSKFYITGNTEKECVLAEKDVFSSYLGKMIEIYDIVQPKLEEIPHWIEHTKESVEVFMQNFREQEEQERQKRLAEIQRNQEEQDRRRAEWDAESLRLERENEEREQKRLETAWGRFESAIELMDKEQLLKAQLVIYDMLIQIAVDERS